MYLPHKFATKSEIQHENNVMLVGFRSADGKISRLDVSMQVANTMKILNRYQTLFSRFQSSVHGELLLLPLNAKLPQISPNQLHDQITKPTFNFTTIDDGAEVRRFDQVGTTQNTAVH